MKSDFEPFTLQPIAKVHDFVFAVEWPRHEMVPTNAQMVIRYPYQARVGNIVNIIFFYPTFIAINKTLCVKTGWKNQTKAFYEKCMK